MLFRKLTVVRIVICMKNYSLAGIIKRITHWLQWCFDNLYCYVHY